jgi:hypothetical protein
MENYCLGNCMGNRAEDGGRPGVDRIDKLKFPPARALRMVILLGWSIDHPMFVESCIRETQKPPFESRRGTHEKPGRQSRHFSRNSPIAG